MLKYLPQLFIKEKVLELQNALFYHTSETVLRIPTQVINTLYADDLGQVWFIIRPPFQSIAELDKEFSARLDFFRKGKQFYLKAFGKAYVVTDPEELNTLTCIPDDIKDSSRSGNVVLLKIKIQNAEYYENEQPAPIFGLGKLKSDFYKWFSFQQRGSGRPISKRIALDNMINLPHMYSN